MCNIPVSLMRSMFSSMHVSGEQLNLLSGVAAILRFPMPDIEDVQEDLPAPA